MTKHKIDKKGFTIMPDTIGPRRYTVLDALKDGHVKVKPRPTVLTPFAQSIVNAIKKTSGS